MAFVLDASVALSWFFPDEALPESSAAWRRSATENMLVPPHWWFDVRNGCLSAERRGRLSGSLTLRALSRLGTLAIAEAAKPDEMQTFALARRYRLTFGDAAYLELAQREQLALATLDRELAAAATGAGVALVV